MTQSGGESKVTADRRDTEGLVPPPFLKRLSLWLAWRSAVSILLSIAVSQILLALALGVLLLSGLPLRWPRIAIPLGLFLGWTLVSLAFSPDPAVGLPQVRKMLVFLMLLIVYSSVRHARRSQMAGAGVDRRRNGDRGARTGQFAGDVAARRAGRAARISTIFTSPIASAVS